MDQLEALRRAEEGLWLFEDEHPAEQLVAFAIELLMKAGRREDAAAHLWRAFENLPSLELYKRIRQLAGEDRRNRALEVLDARLALDEPTRWHYPADLLVSILMHEKMFDEAWPCFASIAHLTVSRRSSRGRARRRIPVKDRDLY